MKQLVSRLQELEPTLADAGPTQEMHEMGGHIQTLKDTISALSGTPLSQDEITAHTDLSNRAAFGLVTEFLNADISPVMIANVFLYYWLRTSTINANVPEAFFQKLERNWETVVDQVDIFVDTLPATA